MVMFVSGFSSVRQFHILPLQNKALSSSPSCLRVGLTPVTKEEYLDEEEEEEERENSDHNNVSIASSSSSSQKSEPLFDVSVIDSDSISMKNLYDTTTEDAGHTEEGDDFESQFYDISYEDDEDIWNDDEDNEERGEIGDEAFFRDEDAILTEREDRFYVDEKGFRRQIERCILVGVEDVSELRRVRREKRMNSEDDDDDALEEYFVLEESLREMRELIRTSGMEIVGEVTQRLNDPNPRTYIGTGKLNDVKELLDKHDCCTVVFDAELTPGQQKQLENTFNKQIIQNDFLGSEMGEIKVLDRTALILDIFAQHAKTKEGKLQVDLALHIFRKPRLTRMWTHLERQSGAGGVGLRGPGESQLEIDKRLLRDRIITLKRQIDNVQKQRDLHRKGRDNLGLPTLALVGYTNAGKSTLLNYLTRAGVMAEDILFATLDPTTRRVKLPGLKTHPEVLLTDTVGFIQKLPTQLVAAFRATLEEVREADVLIHVIDVTNPVWKKQESAVKTVLSEIEAGDTPVVRVFNKIDQLDPDDAEDLKYEAAMMTGHSVAVSSTTGDGMEDFVATVEEALMGLLVPIEVELPYTKGKEVNMVQEVGHVETIDYLETGTYIEARVPQAVANRLKPYYVNPAKNDKEDIINNRTNSEDKEIDWVAIGRGRHTAKEL